MLKVRIITGLILAILVVVFVAVAPVWLFNAVLLVAIAVAAYEFFRLTLPVHPSTSIALGVFTTLILSASLLFLDSVEKYSLPILTFSIMGCFSFYLFRKHEISISLKQIAFTLLGVFYVGILFAHCGLLRKLPHGIMWIYLIFATTFLADTGAYIVGRVFGRHKLAPLVSPGKTIEGFFGGLLASLLASIVVALLFWKESSLIHFFIIGFLSGILGPLGDLSESLIKRSVNIKDSGNLIPGHGGLLDRVDALLFSSPILYYYAKFFIY